MTGRVRDDSWKPGANAAMERWADGEREAAAELYELLAPRLHAFLLLRTRDRGRAEDLLQETFLRMTRCRGHFVRGTDVATWAFTIARRLFIDEHRKDHEAAELDPQRADLLGLPDALVGQRRLCARVMEALARMPEGPREAFVFLHFDGLSVADAARIVGTSGLAMKLRVHRARKALRGALGDEVRELLESSP